MRGRRLLVAFAAGALVVVVAACGAAATPIPSAAAPSVAAPSVAPSAAASVAAPSEATSSEAAPSEAPSAGTPSFALPSLPSEAKDLEAELPGTICGQTAQKLSMNGQSFLSSANGNEFAGALSALGKSPSDVAVAIAAGGTDCSAVAIRISGVDQNTLQTAMVGAAQQAGEAATQTSLGGKTVYVATDSNGSKSYVYFKNDTMFITQADTEANATTIIQALP